MYKDNEKNVRPSLSIYMNKAEQLMNISNTFFNFQIIRFEFGKISYTLYSKLNLELTIVLVQAK